MAEPEMLEPVSLNSSRGRRRRIATLDDAVRFERACLACPAANAALWGQADGVSRQTTSCSPITRSYGRRCAECTAMTSPSTSSRWRAKWILPSSPIWVAIIWQWRRISNVTLGLCAKLLRASHLPGASTSA